MESRQSWSDRERDRPRDSVVQFPDAVDSDKDSDEDVSIQWSEANYLRAVHTQIFVCFVLSFLLLLLLSADSHVTSVVCC